MEISNEEFIAIMKEKKMRKDERKCEECEWKIRRNNKSHETK